MNGQERSTCHYHKYGYCREKNECERFHSSVICSMIGLRLQRHNPGGPLVPNRNTDTATRIDSSQSLFLFLPCWMKESWEVLTMIGADQ